MTTKKPNSTVIGKTTHGDKKGSVDGAYDMRPQRPEKNNEDDTTKKPKPLKKS
ncbi:hypothetical protein I5P86_27005 [Pseudomonas glycinae]|jgi:hypothetical protein|uniref:hypothetical protein n=1 Tax=Pseudomonas glycinae TaxID=1785145 RepID=UPI0018D66C53|nr:hypothetical protein [Pseudomonas glycinae]MBH3408723.1 hypothetical protein [Pseudomonas glycinae]